MSEPALHETTFKPNPVQSAFIQSRAKADLFSSRMGEGKSTALAWSSLFHTRHNPGARWMFVRDTWENLSKTTLKTFFQWFPPGIYGTWEVSKKTWTWASGVAEGEIEWVGMDDNSDASKLLSKELAGIAIDEPAPAVGSAGIDEMVFDLGMSRLRQPGMNWYAMKLAENNPDEQHWTYKKFVLEDPDSRGFKVWQPTDAENAANLPPSYYAELRKIWEHRPDLVRRFVEGEFGFQSIGKAVTPQWSDKLHLAVGLVPQRQRELVLLWDWGHNPTCIVTQVNSLGQWLILDAIVGDGIGAEELIADAVTPLLQQKYPRFSWRHAGDPAGTQREQASIFRSPVLSLKRKLGGTWMPGPVKFEPRVNALQAVLTRVVQGKGLLRVDRDNAAAVWQALRGGWHYHISRTGIISAEAVKDINSHPGDAMSYGAAVLYPTGRLRGPSNGGSLIAPEPASYFGGPKPFLGRPGLILPKHGDKL